ncbi:EF-hand domain-containing protein [Brevundimonas subvibrioides]|uniref:EF-hand domain-containing protein n=1 Tax=Brevundimonas subvibrioides TaxID=74313 RepID=UPI0022B39B5A|nr:EF-hand domain-containing protein [Brevundimonas subvibrioides]
MIVIALTTLISCVPPGMTMSGSTERVVRVSGPDILNGANAAEAEAFYRNSFALTDADKDGYISGLETPLGTRGDVSSPFEPAEAGSNVWISLMDTDGDRRVSWNEFSGYLLPMAAIGRCQRDN